MHVCFKSNGNFAEQQIFSYWLSSLEKGLQSTEPSLFFTPSVRGELISPFFLILGIDWSPGAFRCTFIYKEVTFPPNFLNWIFDPRTRGLKNKPPNYMSKITNHPRGLFFLKLKWSTLMHWLQSNKTRSLQSAILEKFRKNRKKNWRFCKMVIFCGGSWFFFPKWDLAESWGFLRCNQCIKTVYLS